jgi:hypothetical protein
MRFIGDVHGEIERYRQLIADADESIQLGEMGFGFIEVPEFPPQHRFIRGNHDDPTKARAHPNYLGDFGILPSGIFFVSGAWSIDQKHRTIGVSWWEDEELSIAQCDEALELYESETPYIVVSHDCPIDILRKLIYVEWRRSRTGQLLQEMFELHQPQWWVFAHHHRRFSCLHRGTRFIGLDELQAEDIIF